MRATFARRVFPFARIWGLAALPSRHIPAEHLGRDVLRFNVSYQEAL